MHGRYQIKIKNSRNSYSFELKRNITVLRGDSGTGKTTLFRMVRDYNESGRNSGVSISCDRPVIAMEKRIWETEIERIENSIIVIDEDSKFICSKEFAKAVRHSNNYFLLITRHYLAELPISVDEIYVLSGAKNKKFVPLYHEKERIFDDVKKSLLPFKPEVIITEDDKSGYQFFAKISQKMGIKCVSAGGKSKIYRLIRDYKDKDTVVIADGAAFGAEIADLAEAQKQSPNKIAIFLPESFEWLILKSGLVDVSDARKLDEAYDYADSVEFMSWEQYFTKMLVDLTKENKLKKYSKSRLSRFYLQEKSVNDIKSTIHGIDLE